MIKKILLSSLMLSSSFFITSSVVSCSLFQKDEIDKLLNFRKIDYKNTENIEVARNMQNDVSIFRQEYLNIIQDDWKKQYHLYEKKLESKEQINSKELKKPLSVKSQLPNGVYLAQQPYPHYYPRATELRELNGYEIVNWSFLETLGYKLYVSSSNADLLEIVNGDESDVFIYNTEKYIKLNNIKSTDQVYFRTSENIKETDFNTSVKLKFIAIREKLETNNEFEILVTPPNVYGNTSIDVSITNSDLEKGGKAFINYKLGEWLNYEYIKNINLISLELTSFILAYIEIIGNYMFLLKDLEDGKKEVNPLTLLKGFDTLKKGKYGGITPSDLLYYGFKYNSAFGMFTIILENNSETIPLTIDQNMSLNVKVEENLENEIQGPMNRTKLDFNPMFDFDYRISDFIEYTWKLLLKLDQTQCGLIGGYNVISTECDKKL